MLDVIGQACYVGALPAFPLVLAAAAYALRRRRAAVRWASALSFAVATTVALLWVGFAIVLRDGLAPGMVPSEGGAALGNALPGVLVGLAVGALIASTGAAFLWSDGGGRTSNAA